MAPTAGKKGAAAPRKGKTDKPTIKHVQLGLVPLNGSQKPLRQASLTKFSVSLPSPSSSQELPKKSPIAAVKVKASTKGKERAVEAVEDAGMWMDRFAPTSLEELAVHKRKVQDVRHWLEEATTGGPSGTLKTYRRLLALSGPAGAGKTATIRVLAREMGIEIMEWQNSQDGMDPFGDEFPESHSHTFSNFLSHEAGMEEHLNLLPLFSRPTTSHPSAQRVLLLEDLPNVLHPGTKEAFQKSLEDIVNRPNAPPVVLIVSESGARGMGAEGWRREERWDMRNILGPRLLQSPYVTEVQFNPVAATIMHSALSRILSQTHPTTNHLRPSPETLDMIVESSMGDVRSAINALQFACRVQMAEVVKGGGSGKRRRGKKGKVGEVVRKIIEGVTRNEQVLALFHILGKLFYNKRFGDDPEENEDPVLEASIRGSLPLPQHLSAFERRPSKVDVNTLYADSPVDISLLSAYCHQNYPQFCSELEELEVAAEWISYGEAFSMDSEHINMQLPEYAFHLLGRGLLMSLPSPVPRRGQKLLKSAYWEFSRKERDGIESLRSWSRHDVGAARDHRTTEMLERAWLMGRAGLPQPKEVSLLAYMPWMPPIRGGGYGQQLLEEGEVAEVEPAIPMSQNYKMEASDDEGGHGTVSKASWLEDDDIEED
ncbi:hypothetical protein CALVIDRAFT_539005 [Calocera viscosa TUFC12733]|uniref:Rad17-domain-containing protein n=1 Tax=Calocera viscosa (strain TUFC12733) TaxID=1330018 RepID=A0A167KE83_CALVF|nr:hypothetical protein CALVIDRAFT_539005 [Calocera viscosa TUFC12733]